MSEFEIGAIGLAIMVLLVAMRFHIALAMGGVAFIGIVVIAGWKAAISVLQVVPFSFASNLELSAVPLFILMGTLAFRSGMTESLFKAARLWLSALPGGLAVAANLGCAGFAAVSGSSLVTAVTMGKIAVPEMLKYRYDRGLATGVVAAAGTLGVMIPPSIPMLLYAYFAQVPVGDVFAAGILPGLLTALLYTVMIVVRSTLNPDLAPRISEHVAPSEKWQALAEVWPLPVIILIVIGTIYTGIASATESASFGVAATLLVAVLRRSASWKMLWASLLESAQTAASVFFVAIGAVLLTRFMAYSNLPETMSEVVISFGLDPLVLTLMTGLIFLILGCLLDPIGLLLLGLPVFLPIMKAAGVNLVWFGILFIKYIEIGLITPPVGMNVFAIKAMSPDIPVFEIFKGTLWFFAMEMIVLALLIAFPAISLYLPGLAG